MKLKSMRGCQVSFYLDEFMWHERHATTLQFVPRNNTICVNAQCKSLQHNNLASLTQFIIITYTSHNLHITISAYTIEHLTSHVLRKKFPYGKSRAIRMSRIAVELNVELK